MPLLPLLRHIAGLAVCRTLLSYDMTVIAAAVHPFSNRNVASDIDKVLKSGKLKYQHLDLASFRSIEMFAKDVIESHDHIHHLVNNAGVMLAPQQKTAEGFELHMGVNFIGHAYLTKLLLPKLKSSSSASSHSVIINVSSSTHRIPHLSLLMSGLFFSNPPFYSPHLSYGLSKLAIRLYTEELSNQLSTLAPHVRVMSVHPGIVATSLYRNVVLPLQLIQKYLFVPCLFRTPAEGAAVVLNCFADDTITPGAYVENSITELMDVTPQEKEKFWQLTWQYINKRKGSAHR